MGKEGANGIFTWRRYRSIFTGKYVGLFGKYPSLWPVPGSGGGGDSVGSDANVTLSGSILPEIKETAGKPLGDSGEKPDSGKWSGGTDFSVGTDLTSEEGIPDRSVFCGVPKSAGEREM